jgi:predicted ATPase
MRSSDTFYIDRLFAKNYKNISLDTPENNIGNLNVFIGPNGSGKSNVIRMLRFLRDSLISTPSTERGITPFEEALEALGGEKILDAFVKRPAIVDFSYHFSPTRSFPDGCVLAFSLFVKDRLPFISREFLFSRRNNEEEPFYYYKSHDRQGGSGLVSVYENGTKNRKKRKTRFQELASVPANQVTLASITELLEQSNFSPEDTPVYRLRRNILDAVSGWRFYNANEMNLYDICHAEPKIGPSDSYLSTTGENLPLVLDNLIQQDFEFEERLNKAMKAILPETRRVRPVRSGRLNLTVEWHLGAKEPFYLSDMSDGSVRMLCWAIILHSPFLPSLLVIDEPELSLHPAWLPILAEWIKTASRKTQVIVSTHSPDLLDQFTDEIGSICCFSKINEMHYSLKRLSPEQLGGKLEEGWQLGDLYRVGDPTVGGWPW